jgi:hypothetical protein
MSGANRNTVWAVLGWIVTTVIAGVALWFTWKQIDIGRDTANAQMRAYVFAKHYRWVNNVRVDGDCPPSAPIGQIDLIA